MRKIIIDCDPGHDDAVAILLAFARKDIFDIAAITCVCGNNTLDKMTYNAQLIATIAEEFPLIAKGAEAPLLREPTISSEFHGESGMDGYTNPPAISCPIDENHAIEVMKRIIETSEEKITIVALGPLTNIALLLKVYPHVAEKIEMISLMGGGIKGGNITPLAEFNIYVDPEAAQIVFQSGVPILMSGLDVTEQVEIFPAEYEPLRGKSAVGRFFSELMDFYILKTKEFGTTGCVMHDPCAVVCLIAPEAFQGIRGKVDIGLYGEERGQTVLTPSEAGTTLVYTEVDSKKVAETILEAIASFQ